ncbi:heparan-alpha-glucosaminide N-acetyltransferase domain-containing protein [Nocardia sp. NPDC052566]|uniref:heparan-alpha-glucosaminide N-acetyltransferase domain-containing protein n=1 Tax=Nocardia sp. NPDC052566 TaxID=3364330 RepID=UPI0037CA4D25
MAVRTSDPSRISALDTARGLAVIGMIAAHTLGYGDLTWSDPGHWHTIASGRSSILFAVLGGASLALMTGRMTPPTGADLVAARLRVIVRACLLFLIGGILTATGTEVAVILEFYAVMFVLAVPFLTWPPRKLLTAAAVWAVAAPVLLWWLYSVLPESARMAGGIVNLGITGTYPAALWVVFILIGLAIGRSDLTAPLTRKRLLGWGIAAAVIGYGGAWLATWLFVPQDNAFTDFAYTDADTGGTVDADKVDLPDPGFTSLLNAEPHSGTTFEILGSAGVAAAILGLLLICQPVLGRFLAPITAIGYMPLTVYTGHVVSLAIWESNADSPALFLSSVAIAAAGSLLWIHYFGRGPLERAMTWVTKAAVRTGESKRESTTLSSPGEQPRPE